MKLLLYCTKAKPMLRKLDKYFLGKHTDNYYWKKGQTVPYNVNGKIVAECDFEVERLQIVYGKGWETKTIKGTENIEKLTCLSRDELYQYCKGNGYAIHIKNLHIFDKPRDIRNYYNIAARTMADCMNQKALLKAPQNMCNAYDVYKNHYILISIKPEWLCKILNCEKTIEVRKKVLKEMLE